MNFRLIYKNPTKTPIKGGLPVGIRILKKKSNFFSKSIFSESMPNHILTIQKKMVRKNNGFFPIFEFRIDYITFRANQHVKISDFRNSKIEEISPLFFRPKKIFFFGSSKCDLASILKKIFLKKILIPTGNPPLKVYQQSLPVFFCIKKTRKNLEVGKKYFLVKISFCIDSEKKKLVPKKFRVAAHATLNFSYLKGLLVYL